MIRDNAHKTHHQQETTSILQVDWIVVYSYCIRCEYKTPISTQTQQKKEGESNRVEQSSVESKSVSQPVMSVKIQSVPNEQISAFNFMRKRKQCIRYIGSRDDMTTTLTKPRSIPATYHHTIPQDNQSSALRKLLWLSSVVFCSD